MNEVDPLRSQFELAKRQFYSFVSKKPEVIEALYKKETPFLIMDLGGIQNRFKAVRDSFKGFEVFYAVKANDDIEVLKSLVRLGAGFEVASIRELESVIEAGGEISKIISSNPVKPPDFIKRAYEMGLNRFVVDSETEVQKLARLAPRSRVYVRLSVPNEGSDWPLAKKFGTDVENALSILELSRQLGLIPYGITFHVGSQCNNLRNWLIGIKRVSELWELARNSGIKLRMLNVGGGLPVEYTYRSLEIEEIARYIQGLLKKFLQVQPAELQIEPGRGIVGDQGIMVCSVIGKAKRGEENWLYIDAGVFNGLAEAIGGIRYGFFIDREGPLKEWTVGGVSCDSVDVVARKVALPEPEVGDRIIILSAGAYTTVYASNFNGFRAPYTLCF
ncbi:MAG: type III PLP-dependent enzyme [Aquificaceae bacterium]